MIIYLFEPAILARVSNLKSFLHPLHLTENTLSNLQLLVSANTVTGSLPTAARHACKFVSLLHSWFCNVFNLQHGILRDKYVSPSVSEF